MSAQSRRIRVLAGAAYVLLACATTVAAQDESGRRARPAPRWPNGTIRHRLWGGTAENLPGSDRVYLFMTGGSHSFRVIYIDGRSHPTRPEPSYYGHSIGWWDGDTLVIDTVGFNEGAWMDRSAMPHTDRLHMLERLTRIDFDTLNYDVTIDDPGAYTAPWTSGYTKQWEPAIELFEYVCQENNYGPQLMIGIDDGERRGRGTVVP